MRGVYGTHTIYLTNLSTAIHLINWQIITNFFFIFLLAKSPKLRTLLQRYSFVVGLSLCFNWLSNSYHSQPEKHQITFIQINPVDREFTFYLFYYNSTMLEVNLNTHITFLRRSQTKCKCCALAFLKHTQVEFCLKSQLLNTNLTPSTQEHH